MCFVVAAASSPMLAEYFGGNADGARSSVLGILLKEDVVVKVGATDDHPSFVRHLNGCGCSMRKRMTFLGRPTMVS